MLKSSRGFSTLESIWAIALLAVFALGLSKFSGSMRAQSSSLSEQVTCQAFIENITSSIRGRDNALVVRNWLPLQQTPASTAPTSSIDPYCKNASGSLSICDAVPFFDKEPNTNYAVPGSYRTYQNNRGASTWARAIYNRYRSDGICSTAGRLFTTAEFNTILIAPTVLPSGLTEARLRIKDDDVNCGSLSSARNASFQITLAATILEPSRTVPIKCSSTIHVKDVADTRAPVLTLTRVTNGSGITVPDSACSEPRSALTVASQGISDYRTVKALLRVDEPGAFLLCRRVTYEGDPTGKFQNCPDLRVASYPVTVTPGPTELSYNTALDATITLPNLPDQDSFMYTYEFKAVDVGGNESKVVTANFKVDAPTCPALNTIACDAYVADSCGSASACGPGTMGCAGTITWTGTTSGSAVTNPGTNIAFVAGTYTITTSRTISALIGGAAGGGQGGMGAGNGGGGGAWANPFATSLVQGTTYTLVVGAGGGTGLPTAGSPAGTGGETSFKIGASPILVLGGGALGVNWGASVAPPTAGGAPIFGPGNAGGSGGVGGYTYAPGTDGYGTGGTGGGGGAGGSCDWASNGSGGTGGRGGNGGTAGAGPWGSASGAGGNNGGCWGQPVNGPYGVVYLYQSGGGGGGGWVTTGVAGAYGGGGGGSTTGSSNPPGGVGGNGVFVIKIP